MSMMLLCTTLTEAAVEPSVQSVVNILPRMTWSTMLCWNMTSKGKIGESENNSYLENYNNKIFIKIMLK